MRRHPPAAPAVPTARSWCAAARFNSTSTSSTSTRPCDAAAVRAEYSLTLEHSLDHLFGEVPYVSAEQVQGALLDHFGINFVGEPTSVLVDRRAFARFGPFDPALVALCDFEYWARVGANTGLAYVLREPGDVPRARGLGQRDEPHAPAVPQGLARSARAARGVGHRAGLRRSARDGGPPPRRPRARCGRPRGQGPTSCRAGAPRHDPPRP